MEICRSRMYTIRAKLVLFKLACYKIPTVIPKATIMKITKKYADKGRRRESKCNKTKNQINKT